MRDIAAGDEETLRAVEVLAVADTDAGTERCIDAQTQVEVYAADTRTALADGFFADHRNMLVLERMADRYGRSVVLRTARHWPARLIAALGLTRVRAEHQEI